MGNGGIGLTNKIRQNTAVVMDLRSNVFIKYVCVQMEIGSVGIILNYWKRRYYS